MIACDKYCFLADTVPTHTHLDVPWIMGYDLQPGLSAQERVSIQENVQSHKYKIIFNHDSMYWGAKGVKNEAKDQRWSWDHLQSVPETEVKAGKDNRFYHLSQTAFLAMLPLALNRADMFSVINIVFFHPL